MTASLRTLGLVDSVGIDCIMPNRLNGPILKLDLLNPDHLSFTKDLINNDACVYVHFAPPCGTSSRARLIQDPDKPMPPPLRNDFYPNGLPWLTKEQQERVDKANELYRITCELILLCQSRGILWSCENPGRSFMWQTKPFVDLFSKIQCMSTDFHHCMFGSARRKLTKLIHNIHCFHQLHKLCDNQHEHEPWGQKADGSWATSEETAYPWPLARSIAAQVVLQLQSQGIVCHLPSFAEQEATLQAMRASTNIQPRRHLPSFVPEFKEVVHNNCGAPLPSNARVLSTPKRGYVASAGEVKDGQEQVTVGVHFSPEEFVAEAVRLGHPTDHISLFPKEVKQNVEYIKNKSIHQLATERTEEVRRWVNLTAENSHKESELKDTLSPRIAEILKGKKLWLLDSLIRASGHEDVNLVEDIKRGFDLTGSLPTSGVFSHKFRPASMTCKDLRKVSEALLGTVQSAGDSEIDRGLYEATVKEGEKGFIEGPVEKESLPAGSTLTKRFPVKQKNKVRPIDDYKASLVNYAVTQTEGVTIHTIDHIAAMTAWWMRSGALTPEDALVAKCWDLSDAYKQVPLSDEAFDLDSYLAVFDPGTSSAKIFKQRVLPFGSVASVTAFLRVSLALWKIGSSLLHLMWSVYFDDFLCLARSSESRHVDFCVSTLFSLLGWKVSEHKLLDFNTVCKVLGVQLDLKQSGSGICFVTNTAERVEELVAEIDEAMKSNLLPRKDGEKLRGRLQFASSQMFGRRFRRLLKVLSNHVTAGRQTLSDRTRDCLSEIRGLLLKNAPRKVESLQAEVVHIYVDASFDRDKYSGLGGMVVDMSKKTLFFFSESVDNDTLDEIMSKGQKTVIQELEMMAVLAAVKSWHGFLKSRKVVLFTDSESVRGSFLKTWSANDNSDDMINVIFEVEEGFDIPLWIERVPSQSNPSDVLSREVVAVFEGAERVRVNPREIWKSLVK